MQAVGGEPTRDDRWVVDDTMTLEPRAQPTVPETIGRLTVEYQLGVGGMGQVLAARDDALGRSVAVKLIHGNRNTTRMARGEQRRLLREAQAMARLSHPNVVQIYDVGTVDEQVYLSMELVEGSTLRTWLRITRRTWPEIIRTFVAAGEGLAAAHRASLVHRDFKPANVLVSEDGRVLVTDFGLARGVGPLALDQATGSQALGWGETTEPLNGNDLFSTVTASNLAVGTPAYMPPEQHLRGMDATARSDQFAFCAALYEALYGVKPFDGTTMYALFIAKRKQELCPPGPLAQRVPWRVHRAVLRGLSEDPSKRWPSMDALLAQLRPQPRRRWRLLWGLLGVLGLLAILLGSRLLDPVVAPFVAAPCQRSGASVVGGLVGAGRCSEATSPADASAGAPDLLTRVIEADKLVDDARYQPAADMATEVVVEADHRGLLALKARALLVLGRAETPLARLETAQAHLSEALFLAESEGDDRTAIRSALGLGYLLGVRLGRSQDGLRWVRHAEARLNRIPRDDLLRAEVLYLDGAILHEGSSAADAAQVLRRALALTEGYPARPQSPLAVDISMVLGMCLVDLGRPIEAVGRLQATLAEARLHRPAHHPQVGKVAFNLSLIMADLGRWDEVTALRQEALEIFEASLGPGHPLVAIALRGLGDAKYDTGRSDEARPYYQRALDHLRQQVGEHEPNHPAIAQLTERLAQTQAKAGEYDEALTLLRRAVTIARAADDRGQEFRTRRLLVRLLLDQEREQEAYRELEAMTLELREHPTITPSERREIEGMWARGQWEQGQLDAAAVAYGELVVETRHEPPSRERVKWSFDLARVELERGQPWRAVDRVRRARAELESIEREPSPLHVKLERWLEAQAGVVRP